MAQDSDVMQRPAGEALQPADGTVSCGPAQRLALATITDVTTATCVVPSTSSPVTRIVG